MSETPGIWCAKARRQQALFDRLHRQMHKIAKQAFDRSAKKIAYDRNVKHKLKFTETVSPYLQLYEVIEYNRNTGNISVSSYFLPHHKNKAGYYFIDQACLATRPASFFRVVPSISKKHNAGVNAGQAIEIRAS